MLTRAECKHKDKYIFLIIGKSGVGKTSVTEYIANTYGLKYISSYTTRPPRYENESGHVFLTPAEFDEIRNDLVAYTFFDGYEYGTTNKQVEESQMYVIDPAGVGFFLANYTGDKMPITVFLDAPTVELVQRMRARGDSADKIVARATNDLEQFVDTDKYDLILDTHFRTIEEIGDELYEFMNVEPEYWLMLREMRLKHMDRKEEAIENNM